MDTLDSYIELNRRFSVRDGSVTKEDAASRSYLDAASGDLGWDRILEERLVVVLGEPGSGKSWEFRNRCAALRKSGAFAFSVELERLVSESFADVLSGSEFDTFQQWHKTNQPAHFFLDSVDESKLRRQADFYVALDKIRNAIGNAASRSYVMISSRISEWQPVTDRQAVMQRFAASPFEKRPSIRLGKPSTTSNDVTTNLTAPGILIVQLEPLDRERVRIFVRERGIPSHEQFLEELDRHFAWEFARRPIDVVDLADFWKAKQRLGSLTEIIEHDVVTKLRETTLRRTNFTLSEAKARAGAEALAAATIFCKQQQFKVPDDSFLAGDALDAALCLPADWLPKEVGALLSRPLFDSATYGRVRFHHRRVSEYLAAAWLRTRMQEGCPSHVLMRLLFQDSRGKKVVRQSLLPVVPWLCPGRDRWNAAVQAGILQASPEIFLEYGDAAALPIEYRRALLRAWVNRNKERQRVFVQSSHDALRRLAATELTGDISEMLADRSTSADIREELVQVVRYGKLVACTPTLLNILSHPDEPEDLKQYVLAAIHDMGMADARRQVWEILRPLPALSVGACVVACEALYPDTINAVEFVALLQKAPVSSAQWNSFAWKIERHVSETLPREHSGTLLAELNRLVQLPPRISFANKETRISDRFEWSLEVLRAVLARLLAQPALSQTECDAAVESLSLLGESRPFRRSRSEDKSGDLDGSTHKHPGLRHKYFWYAIHRFRAENPSVNPRLHDVFGYASILVAAETDIEWIISDVKSASRHEDRLLALDMALRLLGGWNRRYARIMYQAIHNDAALTAKLRLARSGARYQAIRQLYYRWTDRSHWNHWWFMRQLALRRWMQGIRDRWFLWRNLSSLRTGKNITVLARLCREADENGTKWGPLTWDALILKRGRRIADAVRTGCIRAWREHVPKLPHERTDPNQIEYYVVVGLAGLQAAYREDKSAFASFTDDEARLATRYAVNEMNGFPDWFAPLVTAKPASVADVLRECVLGEWDYSADREFAYDVLADVAWEGGILARLVRADVLKYLQIEDPPHPTIRDAALSIVLKTAAVSDAEIAGIAAEKCRRAPIQSEAFALWCAVWLQVDADPCIAFLSECLGDQSDDADAAVLRVCSLLDGSVRRRLPLLAYPSFSKDSTLRRLIPLIYRHVRPAEDVEHIGEGPFTPTDRDDARRFRDSLLVRLAQSENAEATVLLKELIDEKDLAKRRDWVLHLLEDRVIRDADSSTWEPSDIRVFAHDYETDPRTDRELFDIIVGRLIDIKNDVELGENSLREEVQSGADEYMLRRWLARKLVERSRGRYTIPQEEEIDQEQRPDLRAENPKTSAVSIEVKWADNWTVGELYTGLESQLVGQYLRDHRSRHGVYVLGTRGKKKHWKLEDRNLTFREVYGLIEGRAREITAENQGVERLQVIGIDFTNRPDRTPTCR
jgi:hypothetical protein